LRIVGRGMAGMLGGGGGNWFLSFFLFFFFLKVILGTQGKLLTAWGKSYGWEEDVGVAFAWLSGERAIIPSLIAFKSWVSKNFF